ncbi:putative membrane protein [Alkalibacillus filiformis]|uniref:Membrane protein n=1 Tax=Alkalibacillus filiformis TaxID=200990 RepID=A0ABU0DXH0_9BACI|nr:putative membrane protein [Alkalibacillus filiformis]
MTEAVPGVSGSTVAMILAIYEKLIFNLSLLQRNVERKRYRS